MKIISKDFFKSIFIGAVLYAIFSFVSVLVFALVITYANVGASAIKWVNQIIKVFSMFFACFLAVKENKGLIKGLFIGIFGGIILFFILSVFGIVRFDVTALLVEILFCAVLGIITGIIAVNLRK